jgi:uncharacterized repeat protein (TIGR03803 family)
MAGLAPATGPTLNTLVSFTGADGKNPQGGLMADAAGDLFGTTSEGGANGDGVVFEIAKTGSGYAGAPTVLVSFTGADGSYPQGSLIADAAGDLFGTTYQGGSNTVGTVFEIARTRHGYASAPTILVSFTGADGRYPEGGLIADGAGDLFGRTISGGTKDGGTIFEIAKTDSGYARAPTTLVDFKPSGGGFPIGGLIADPAGDLLGTTEVGGSSGEGTVFEITDSGFAPPAAAVAPAADIAHSPAPALAFTQAMAGFENGRSAISGPTILASRREAPTVLARPKIA